MSKTQSDPSQFDPGAARQGNFINYYQFNPAKNRVDLIPNDLIKQLDLGNADKPVLGLDVGCNTGVSLQT